MVKYDVIAIGAGDGGLTVAVKLSQSGLKLLLLEKHNIPGDVQPAFAAADLNSKCRCTS